MVENHQALSLLNGLLAAGFRLRLDTQGRVLVAPADQLTLKQREQIIIHKVALKELLASGPRDQPLPFVGWLRLGDGPWQKVCQHPDYATCWGQLINHPICQPAPVVDRTVMEQGRTP